MIHIVNYGIGNHGSVLNMFKRIGQKAIVVSKPQDLFNASKIVLPGVGSFDTAINQINSLGFRDVLEKKVLDSKIPFIGICLGMQLLTQKSEEGKLPGFGWIPGEVIRFPHSNIFKVPHMGWNYAKPNMPSKLTSNVDDLSRFYFVHSYCVEAYNPSHSLMRTNYIKDFDSAIGCDNIYGVQFHPEKSHRFGLNILKNFAEL